MTVCFNPSHPNPKQREKNNLIFIFSFFVVPQKV